MYDTFFHILKRFEDAGIDEPLKEALSLLDTLSSGAVRGMDETFSQQTKVSLQEIIEVRTQGCPLEYILGYGTFLGKSFSCSPAALIPRPETELLAKTAIKLAQKMETKNSVLKIVDMGTGAGNLAISIAAHVLRADILACDICPKALELARENVVRHGLQSRVSLFCGDLFHPLQDDKHIGQIDMVVSNPPFMPTKSLAKLDREIIEHEPIIALDAGAYGIDIFRRLISQSADFLRPGGVLIFEIGIKQESLATLLLQKSCNYKDINYYSDRDGNTKIISAVRE